MARKGTESRRDPAALLRDVREVGTGSAAQYLAYRLALSSGWIRRLTPVRDWQDLPLSKLLLVGIPAEASSYASYRREKRAHPLFFFDSQQHPAEDLLTLLKQDETAIVDEAEGILAGRFRLFGGPPHPLGWPPDWPSTPGVDGSPAASRVALAGHWSSMDAKEIPFDIKLLWEPSRFSWVYSLARAYRLTGAERYAEGFWTLVDSWHESHRPNEGAQWISAQEVALRLMALVFGLHAFSRSPASTAERVRCVAEMVAVHALRIPPTLSYARAQGNNHLLSEAAGLYTAGMLFPEMRQASQWRRHGRRWLIRGILNQVDQDGGYVQHSANYYRLLLHLGLWVTRIADLNGEPFPTKVIEALGRATHVLRAMVDQESGRAPNYGPNDGSNLLPLAEGSQEDFRSTIQAAGHAFVGRPFYAPGRWDELGCWLGLVPGAPPESSETPPPKEGFSRAGLHFFRGGRTWGMLRCARFVRRPGHADQLHFDLWRHGENVVCDAGTYLYNGLPPWENPFSAGRVHNAVIVDGQEPMRSGGRFLWLDWDHGRVVSRGRSSGGGLEWIFATRQAYAGRGIAHQRCVLRAGADLWLVIDEVFGSGPHRFSLGWLLPDSRWRLSQRRVELELPQAALIQAFEGPISSVGLYRAGDHAGGEAIEGASPTWGWLSPTYAVKRPGLFVVAQGEGTLPVRVGTSFLFDGMRQEELEVGWTEPGPSALPFRWLAFAGEQVSV